MKRALIVCVLASCGTTDIDRDVCGNGIVEVGEDCDSTDPRCESCGVTCFATQDCLDYDPDGMTGFVCGPDGFCHAPSGTFQPVAAFAMPAESYRVTDVNGDGFGDLLVQSQTSVTAVFDAASTPTSASIQTPIPRGNAAYAYVDNDLSLDALLPTTDGIVAYTARFGVPSPYPFPSPISPATGAPIFVHSITPTSPFENHLGMVGTFPPSSKLVYVTLDVGQQPPVFLGQVDLCNGNLADLDVSELEVFETSPQHEILAVTLRPPGQPARTCVVTSDVAGLAYDMNQVAFLPTAEPKSRPVLANLRGQPCPSLVIAQGAGQVVEYKPNAAGNPCRFEGVATQVTNAPLGAVPIGSVPLIPAISGRNVALALSSGIYDAVAGAQVNLTEVYRSDRVLTAVRSADLDGDGDTDVVAIGKDAEDLDILDRRLGSFLRFRFDTVAPVGQFILGDFDGNELPDIAYVERDLDEQRLQIAYGTTDQFLPGVNVGTFAAVRSIVRTSIPDSTDPNRLIDDLAVLFDEPVVDLIGEVNFLPAISLLHGSPQRTMLAFFDPRTPPTTSQSQFRGVVAGFFSPTSNGNDVVAIEQAGPTTRVYLSVGATNGGLQSLDANDTSNVADCKGPDAEPTGTALCIDDAHFLAWSVGDSHDLVVAIDSRLEVAAFDPRALAGGPVTMTRWSKMLVAPAGATVRKVQRVVLGESSPRLLVSMGPSLGVTNPRQTGALDLCVFDPVTGPVCEDLSERVSASGFGAQTCIDGGVARVARASRFTPPDSTSPDLVVLCHTDDGFTDALFRISFDGDVIRGVDLIDFVNADVLQIGDVSGDGIDDIVVLSRQTAIPVMTVYRQCNSRDTLCGFAPVTGEDSGR